MNAELIAVGTELLLGDIVNTHAKYLSNQMAELGINVLFHTTVGDNPERLRQVAALALERSDLIVFTGGLGPTKDDLTKETVCGLMGIDLKPDPETTARIMGFFNKSGREMPESNLKQAMVPVGAKVFYNDYGTAPGIAVQRNGKCVIMLPGPPQELVPMFQSQVRRFLIQFTGSVIVSHSLRLFGIGESKVDELLGEMLDQSNPTVALYAKPYEVLIRVTAKAVDKDTCEDMIVEQISKIHRVAGKYIYGADVDSLQEVLVNRLLEQNKTIALAESCTGGLVAEKVTSIPGASGCFSYGIVSYGNQIKVEQLGVDPITLEEFGAVSRQVAEQMAQNARAIGKADIGISITGIAGPGVGTDKKPVGLVYIAAALKNETKTKELHLGRGQPNERGMIRSMAAAHALYLALQVLDEEFPSEDINLQSK